MLVGYLALITLLFESLKKYSTSFKHTRNAFSPSAVVTTSNSCNCCCFFNFIKKKKKHHSDTTSVHLTNII